MDSSRRSSFEYEEDEDEDEDEEGDEEGDADEDVEGAEEGDRDDEGVDGETDEDVSILRYSPSLHSDCRRGTHSLTPSLLVSSSQIQKRKTSIGAGVEKISRHKD